MFTIKSTRIEVDTLIAEVTLHLDNNTDLDIVVPVINPTTKDDVINAILQREVNEKKKFETTPVLIEIKNELDAMVK